MDVQGQGVSHSTTCSLDVHAVSLSTFINCFKCRKPVSQAPEETKMRCWNQCGPGIREPSSVSGRSGTELSCRMPAASGSMPLPIYDDYWLKISNQFKKKKFIKQNQSNSPSCERTSPKLTHWDHPNAKLYFSGSNIYVFFCIFVTVKLLLGKKIEAWRSWQIKLLNFTSILITGTVFVRVMQ